jgi:quercetin dioxygenase-like cupin family protein
MTTFQADTWSLDRFRGPDAPPPSNTDPQTGGDIWKVWRIARTDEVDVLYGMLAPGVRTGPHKHPDTMHYTCILEGQAKVWIEGEMVTLNAGDTLNIPRGALHNFGSANGGDLWFVDMTTPAWDPAKMQFEPEREAEIAEAFAKAWATK